MAVDDQPIRVIDAPIKPIRYGPWKGSMRSVAADRVPPEFMAESDADTPSSNYLYDGHRGSFFRRLGQTIKFDTLPTASGVGLLPAKWSSKCRKLAEFNSDGISDGIPTMMSLVTKETIGSGLDDGHFSNVWIRDQVNDLNYTVGSEYGTSTYPSPGTTQTYRYVPLWFDSGDGGMTRGITEFDRRNFFNGSRGFEKSGDWHYFPSVLGTPSRIRLNSTEAAEGSAVLATGDVAGTFALQSAGAPLKWYIGDLGGGFSTAWESLAASEDTEAKSIFVNNQASINLPCTSSVTTAAMTPTSTAFVYRMRIRLSTAYSGTAVVRVDVTTSDSNRYRKTFNVSDVASPGNWVDMDLTYNTLTDGFGVSTANTVEFGFSTSGGADFTPGFFITYGAFVPLGTSASSSTRLIPSGPLPPTHAGTLSKGNAISGASAAIFERPDADDTDNGWVDNAAGTSLFDKIDEVTADDTDYIKSPSNGSGTCIVRLSDFATTPGTGDTVTINVRAKFTGNALLTHTFGVSITEGGVSRGGSNFTLTTSFANYSFTLTGPQVQAVTDWTNLKLAFAWITGVNVNIYVSQANVSLIVGASEGAWLGSDRFFYGCAYRFKDGSIWMPTLPRFSNNLLSTGFNLFTVDSANPTTSYDSVVWSNIPVGPKDVDSKLLLRTDKINSTLTDSLALNPLGLRIVAEVDNSTTTYVDTFADDDSLQLDPDQLFIHYDHIMPPRARYIFAGDMRVCHSYGGVNPCAIEIAPIGRTADYDLNFTDDTASLYNNDGSYMRIDRDSSGVTTLVLEQTDGTSVTSTKSFAFTSGGNYDTLQKLVDGINATSCAADGQQWRAQLCPGVNPEALTATCLATHARVIASCVTHTSTSLTKAAGGLSAIALGSRIATTNVPVGTYVTKIVSDTELTMSAAATGSSTADATFYQWFGDAPTVAQTNQGYQRVISNSLPGFLYFTKTYLNQFPVEKSSIWMTSASPGSNKSAPNCFSGNLSNKFFPPTGKAGKCMGGVGIRQGFRVLFENQRGIIDNTAHQGSGLDEEYRLKITHDTSGCCSWASVAAGTNFAVYAAPEGIIAGDLGREVLLSDAIWNPPGSDAPTGTGDFTYEIPTSVASTAADTDSAMLYCSIIRDVLRVNYRTANSTTHPDRQVVYDFSSGIESSGLEALFRNGKEPWGWSVPFTRAVTCVGEGRRSDGSHVYGWNQANAGSTGDGRIDEIDTGQTDNGTAISGSITTPWFRFGSRKLSFHRFVAEHYTPTGATAAFDFHRSLSDETYSLTPSTTSTLPYVRDWKELTLPARAPTSAGFFGFRQSAGTQQEIRSLEVYVEELDTYA